MLTAFQSQHETQNGHESSPWAPIYAQVGAGYNPGEANNLRCHSIWQCRLTGSCNGVLPSSKRVAVSDTASIAADFFQFPSRSDCGCVWHCRFLTSLGRLGNRE